jgi:hypothetical protein
VHSQNESLQSLTTAVRVSPHQGNWKQQCNCSFQEFLPDQIEHMELDCGVLIEKTAMPLTETKQLCLQETEQASLLKTCVALCQVSCVWFFWHSSDGTKVSEVTDFASVLLIEQQASLYDKIHPEGWSGLGVGKNVTWHEGAWYFLINIYNKLTINKRLIM